MFKQLNKQGVQSDKGFITQFVGRFEVEYQEENKKISVYVEPSYMSAEKFYLSIRSNSFESWEDGSPISEIKQKEILKNFIEAMEFQGIGVVVE